MSYISARFLKLYRRRSKFSLRASGNNFYHFIVSLCFVENMSLKVENRKMRNTPEIKYVLRFISRFKFLDRLLLPVSCLTKSASTNAGQSMKRKANVPRRCFLTSPLLPTISTRREGYREQHREINPDSCGKNSAR